MSRQSDMIEKLRSAVTQGVLSDVGRSVLRRPLQRMTECAANNYCNLQICPRCAQRKAAAAMKRVLAHMRSGAEHLWYITLAAPRVAIEDGLETLRHSWASMRRGRLFRAVHGGFASREIVRRNSENWHTHLHAVVEAESPLDATAIASEWKSKAGCEHTSPTVEPVQDVERLAAYVTKREPWKWLELSTQDLLDLTIAHVGPYLQTFFGHWPGGRP